MPGVVGITQNQIYYVYKKRKSCRIATRKNVVRNEHQFIHAHG